MLWLNSKEYCTKYKISNTTLKRWTDEGKIKCNKISTRKFLYLDTNIEQEKKQSVVYARVSNTTQKEDLDRQIDLIKNYMLYNGYIVDKVFKDIASGMNEERPDFNKLIDMVLENKVSNIFISTKDRLSRFGYEYLRNIFSKYNCNIVVLDKSDTKTYEDELTDDLLTIIHHFSMKYYSKRRRILKDIKKSLEKSKNEF